MGTSGGGTWMHPQHPQALLFDLDGTLFRTETLAVPAYHAAFLQLRSEGLWREATPPESRLLGSLGMLLDTIWQRVMPGASKAVRDRMNDVFLEKQLELLDTGVGELYEGVSETLTTLHQSGFQLFVASNGLEGYVKGVIRATGLAPLFSGLYSAGEFGTASKVDLVRRLLDDFGITHAWMCGDRSSDVEAGRKNGLPVVGCHWAGFLEDGELDGADILIRTFPALLDHLV